MRKTLVLVTVILLCIVLTLLVGVSGATWCDSDYGKRINVSVNNTGGSALTDYQVYVNLSTNPINETSLRVYNATSCTLRLHWCENITSGDCYGLWINYSSIAVSTWTNNTAIYYDNDTASSASSGTNTFEFFDDFDYGNLAEKCKTNLDNNTRLNNYLYFVFRGDDAVSGISEYYDHSAYPDQWHPHTSTELAGMTIEGYVDMYNLYPPFINASERSDLLNRSKALADYIMTNQYNMEETDVDKRGGFEIHPENPNNRIFVWGTAPDVSGLVALYKATNNDTYKIAAENASKWLLRAENPSVPGAYREYYDHGTTSWGSVVEYASATCRAYFDIWNITGNSTYYDNGVEAADRLVATKSGWWGGACGEHCDLYAARDGLLWAYMYTNNITYLNTAKEFEATVGTNKRNSYYINAQILRFRYDLYNITSNTTYIVNGNKFAEYMWEETFVNESGDDNYGVWYSNVHSIGLHTSSDLWILRAQTLKDDFGLSLIDCESFSDCWTQDAGSWTCENGYVRPPQSGAVYLRASTQLSLSTDFVAHNRVKVNDGNRFIHIFNSDTPLNNSIGYTHFFKTGAGGYFDITTDAANEQYKASALESGNYCDYIVRIKNGDHLSSAYYSNSTLQDTLANTYDTSNAEEWFGFYCNDYADIYIDRIFIRRYASPEPSTTLGSEEDAPESTPVISNVTNGSISPTSQYIDWDVNQTAHNRVVYSNESDLTPAWYSTWDNSTVAPNITLSALDASTQYWYQAWSYNTTNTSLSDNSSTLSFITAADISTLHINNAINIKEDWGRDFNSNLSANVTGANASGVWMNFTNTEFTNTSLGWLNLTLDEWVNESHNVNSPLTNVSVSVYLNASGITNDTDNFWYEVTKRTNTATMDSSAAQNADVSETFYINATCNEEYSDTFYGAANLLEDSAIVATDSSVTNYVNFSHSESSAGVYNYTIRFYNLTHYDNATTSTYSNVTVSMGEYIPPDPINLQNTSGNYWVNYTWEADSGNVTDLYNVSWNLSWYNDTSVTYMNDTIPANGWANITVYAYNSSGSGTLSTGYVSDEVQVPASDTTRPTLVFVDPTELNDTTIYVNHTYINVTVTDSSNTSAFIDWNRSLVGYWSFDSYNSTGVYDNSTYSNFGTFNGGLSTSNLTTGKYGQGLEFDGSNDYVNCGNDASLDMPDDGFTLEAWIKTSNTSRMSIISKMYDDYEIAADDPNIMAWYGDSTGYKVLNWSGFTADGEWHHIVVEINKSAGSGEAWLDGISLGVDTDAPSTGFLSNDLHIGSRGGASQRFNGTIDEVRIHNRALFPEEINASFNNGLYRLENNFTDLADGTYEYYAGAIDSSGNFNVSETRFLTISSGDIDYTPPNPTTLANTTGNYYINYTWVMGVPGNVTDSYNVSWNLSWFNGTLITYMQKEVGASNWGNITVYAYNSSGNGTLSSGSISDNVQAPAYVPGDYIPATPTTLANSTGNYWVNFTWSTGGGANVTDSYNVSWNLTWYNTTLTVYMQKEVGASNWGNITVYAYNSSGNGSLSAGYITDNVQAPAYVPGDYPPATPTALANTTGNGWVNYTWSSGGGANVTNSYNISWNLTWYNTTLVIYMNDTVGEFNWANISVWAHNSTGNGSLSPGSVSDETQAGGGTYTTSMTTSVYNLITYYGSANSSADQFGLDIGSVEYVAMYNTINDTFTTHVVGNGANNFTTTHGRGYFVYINASGSSTYQRNNISASPYDTSLLGGWNTIGWTNATNTNAEGLISSIGSACNYISMLNVDGWSYTTHTKGFTSNNHAVEKGEGYWIWINANTNWGRNS